MKQNNGKVSRLVKKQPKIHRKNGKNGAAEEHLMTDEEAKRELGRRGLLRVLVEDPADGD
jgi:hypothetical protein